jgi:hypothetical protein
MIFFMLKGISGLFQISLLIAVVSLVWGAPNSRSHSELTQFRYPEQGVSAVVFEEEDFEDESYEVEGIETHFFPSVVTFPLKEIQGSIWQISFLSNYFGRLHLLNIPPPTLLS